jgi:uncharacterized protein
VLAGIGLRAPHYTALWERDAPLALVEVHSENFFGDGGQPLAWLERFRSRYPVSFHGVGLSLGSVDPLDEAHLARLASLVGRFEPAIVSEHLSWSSFGGRHANDLLPLPFTSEALDHVVGRISRVQDRLRRRILVENVSRYAAFEESHLAEWEFVSEAVRRAGCGLLLDVNNVWVNACNHAFDPLAYLEAIDGGTIGEIHLGGFETAGGMLIDTHGTAVSVEVWELYRAAVERFGPKPTVIERDAAIPEVDVLLAEAARAEALAR